MKPARAAHWPELDGVRAVAVLSVMIYHFFQNGLFTGGYLGVDIFFVLSGFLITWGITVEWDRADRLSYRRFYARRALRLLPALAAVLVFAVVLVLTVLHGPTRANTIAALPWVVLYVGNWAHALWLGDMGILSHLWSLAVEEQFYLLWPLILVVILRSRVRRERAAAALLLVALGEAAYREILYRHGVSVERLAYGLDTHSDALLVGCAVALWLSSGALGRRRRPELSAGAWLAAGLIAVLIATGNGRTSFQWNYILTALAGGTVIASLVTSPPRAMTAVLASRPAVWVGRRSYGLYVWSFPIYYGLPWPKSFDGWPRYGTEMALSFLTAAASYRYVELPFLRRKSRLGSTDAGSRAGTGQRAAVRGRRPLVAAVGTSEARYPEQGQEETRHLGR